MRLTTMLTISILVAGGIRAEARQAPAPAAAAAFGFKEVSGWLAASADLVPADKYAYKPVATVRSFGELMAHAADGMHWYCGSAMTSKDVEWSDAVAKGPTDKATVVAALKKAIAVCASAHSASSARIERLMGNIAHANLHYGNAIVYLRMLGLKPPSTQ
jgi:cytochrome c1